MSPRWTLRAKCSLPKLFGAAFGVALMLMAAAGGMRQSTRYTEEIQEIASHSVEAAMRSEESRTPTLRRLRIVARDLSRAAASASCRSRGNHSETFGHFLANGLSAPLRC